MENLDNYETLLDELFEDYRRAQAEKAANGAGSSQGGRISDIGRLDELAAELKEIEDMAKDDACETEDTLARAGRSVEAEFIEKTRRSNKLPAKPGDANYYDHLVSFLLFHNLRVCLCFTLFSTQALALQSQAHANQGVAIRKATSTEALLQATHQLENLSQRLFPKQRRTKS